MYINAKRTFNTARWYLLWILFMGLLPCPATAAGDTSLILSRSEYAEKLQGFWLGQCIANWTGLITEMDKVIQQNAANAESSKSDICLIFFFTFLILTANLK